MCKTLEKILFRYFLQYRVWVVVCFSILQPKKISRNCLIEAYTCNAQVSFHFIS